MQSQKSALKLGFRDPIGSMCCSYCGFQPFLGALGRRISRQFASAIKCWFIRSAFTVLQPRPSPPRAPNRWKESVEVIWQSYHTLPHHWEPRWRGKTEEAMFLLWSPSVSITLQQLLSTPQMDVSDAGPALVKRRWLIPQIRICVCLLVYSISSLIQSSSPGLLLHSRGSLTIMRT